MHVNRVYIIIRSKTSVNGAKLNKLKVELMKKCLPPTVESFSIFQTRKLILLPKSGVTNLATRNLKQFLRNADLSFALLLIYICPFRLRTRDVKDRNA